VLHSSPRPVHQVVGALHSGDAVGGEALTIRRHLREAGFPSVIYAGWTDPRLSREALPLAELGAADGPQTVWLYHFSPGSPAGERVLATRGALVVVYHNVTPARFFAGHSRAAERLALAARGDLAALVPRAALALAKSTFSLADLHAAGFPRVARFPFVHDPSRSRSPSAVFRRLYADGRKTVISVGRLAPNKRLEDVLRAFAVLQRRLVPRSRLLLVGDRGLTSYVHALEVLSRDLRLQQVVFCGHVDDDDLQACFDLADVYVSLSEHEGYGVPLVEAMLAGVPVVARDAGAVAETLDGAGVLVDDPRPDLVAGLLDRLLLDAALRRKVVEGQDRVAGRVRETDFRSLVLGALKPVLEAPLGP
jgi:glycosyltransferase involved in cell wall biosynthesis